MIVRRIPYDKDAVIADLAAKVLKPAQIADKHGLTIGNLYAIKGAAQRAGIINSRGMKSIAERLKDESAVFTPALRERIKIMREADLTSTEISRALELEGITAPIADVQKVMARGASDLSGTSLGKKWGITE